MRIARYIAATSLALSAGTDAARAHSAAGEAGHSLSTIFSAWTWDPWTLIPLLVAAGWYGLGVRRSLSEGRAVVVAPVAFFVGGMLLLVVALQSPIDTFSDELFSVHMVQHLLLILAAPPLLVRSDPAIVFLRALPPQRRKRWACFWTGAGLGRALHWAMHPLLVWFLFCGVFVFWHAPGPYQWALDNKAVHVCEHLSFFAISLAFWSIVLPRHKRRRLDHGSTLLFIVSAAILSALPGALMIFAPRPLYPGHAAGVVKWGLTLIEDQQLAGLIMWIPAGTAYVIATCVIFLDWLRESENRVIAAARRSTPLMLTGFLATILLGGCDHEQKRDILNFSGDARRGEELVQQYGCGGCHLIPEVASADGNVGPPLMHVGTRVYIAGFLRNSPENMSVWLQDPQKILPGNAMPSMGISRKDSRDITAFLLSLK